MASGLNCFVMFFRVYRDQWWTPWLFRHNQTVICHDGLITHRTIVQATKVKVKAKVNPRLMTSMCHCGNIFCCNLKHDLVGHQIVYQNGIVCEVFCCSSLRCPSDEKTCNLRKLLPWMFSRSRTTDCFFVTWQTGTYVSLSGIFCSSSISYGIYQRIYL
jgi:hypothetical protein